jgi:hypothetical protein
MKKVQPFNIERVKEFCQLVNEGKTPNEALRIMNGSNGYVNPLRSAGLFWKEKDGTFKAVERIRAERYALFQQEKSNYIKSYKGKPVVKQRTLFCQPKSKQTTTTNAPTMKPKERQLNFIQRVVKSLFKL